MRIIKELVLPYAFILNLILLIGFTSCEFGNKTNERHAIYSEIISKISYSPPPPPSWERDGKEWNHYVDSISKAPVIVGLFDKSMPIDYKISENFLDKNELILILNEKKAVIEIEAHQLKLTPNYTIVSLENKNESTVNLDDFDFIVRVSEVTFDKQIKSALVICSVAYGRLNAYTRLIFLRKAKGQWVITENKTLAIS